MSRFLLFLATRAGGVASFQVCESLEGIRLLKKKNNKNKKKQKNCDEKIAQEL